MKESTSSVIPNPSYLKKGKMALIAPLAKGAGGIWDGCKVHFHTEYQITKKIRKD